MAEEQEYPKRIQIPNMGIAEVKNADEEQRLSGMVSRAVTRSGPRFVNTDDLSDFERDIRYANMGTAEKAMLGGARLAGKGAVYGAGTLGGSALAGPLGAAAGRTAAAGALEMLPEYGPLGQQPKTPPSDPYNTFMEGAGRNMLLELLMGGGLGAIKYLGGAKNAMANWLFSKGVPDAASRLASEQGAWEKEVAQRVPTLLSGGSRTPSQFGVTAGRVLPTGEEIAATSKVGTGAGDILTGGKEVAEVRGGMPRGILTSGSVPPDVLREGLKTGVSTAGGEPGEEVQSIPGALAAQWLYKKLQQGLGMGRGIVGSGG